jgi:hypothetical protein
MRGNFGTAITTDAAQKSLAMGVLAEKVAVHNCEAGIRQAN